jgi:methionyl-tRNA synthetase
MEKMPYVIILPKEISPFEDGDITKESFKDAYNAHLANGLGNLFSRVMKMALNIRRSLD